MRRPTHRPVALPRRRRRSSSSSRARVPYRTPRDSPARTHTRANTSSSVIRPTRGTRTVRPGPSTPRGRDSRALELRLGARMGRRCERRRRCGAVRANGTTYVQGGEPFFCTCASYVACASVRVASVRAAACAGRARVQRLPRLLAIP